MAAPAASCPLLHLPVEMRLLVYAYAVLDAPTITIGTVQLTGSHPDIVHRLYAGTRSPFPGIPHNHEPVVETRYHSALLSSQATTPAATDSLGEDAYRHTRTAYHTLSLLCKQVKRELTSHFSIPSRRQTSLFLQYPHGLHVFHKLTPQLLRQARSLHLAGVYVPSDFSPPRAACLGPRRAPPQEKLQGNIAPNSTEELGDLIKSMFGGPDAQHPVEKLEMRVYFPGEDSYGTVWGDDGSPIVIALRNISLGAISIEVWRGRHATGVYLAATPTAERKRVVSTVWRKLEEGGGGEPARGSWTIDPKWPEWSSNYNMSDGPKGDTIVSIPA